MRLPPFQKNRVGILPDSRQVQHNVRISETTTMRHFSSFLAILSVFATLVSATNPRRPPPPAKGVIPCPCSPGGVCHPGSSCVSASNLCVKDPKSPKCYPAGTACVDTSDCCSGANTYCGLTWPPTCQAQHPCDTLVPRQTNHFLTDITYSPDVVTGSQTDKVPSAGDVASCCRACWDKTPNCLGWKFGAKDTSKGGPGCQVTKGTSYSSGQTKPTKQCPLGVLPDTSIMFFLGTVGDNDIQDTEQRGPCVGDVLYIAD